MKIQKQNSGLLTIKEVRDDDRLKLYEKVGVTEKDGRTYYNIKVLKEDGRKFLCGLNNISINNLIDAFGDETDQWDGKYVRIVIKENQNGRYFILEADLDQTPFKENDEEILNADDIPF